MSDVHRWVRFRAEHSRHVRTRAAILGAIVWGSFSLACGSQSSANQHAEIQYASEWPQALKVALNGLRSSGSFSLEQVKATPSLDTFAEFAAAPPGMRFVLANAATATRLGIVGTCRAYAESRVVICAPTIVDVMRGIVDAQIAALPSASPTPVRDEILAMVRDEPDIGYSFTVGRLVLVLLHEIGHLFHDQDSASQVEAQGTYELVCQAPSRPQRARELAADMSAAAVLNILSRQRARPQIVENSDLYHVALAAMRLELAATPFERELYCRICEGADRQHPSGIFRALIVDAYLRPREDHDESARRVGTILGALRSLGGTCD